MTGAKIQYSIFILATIVINFYFYIETNKGIVKMRKKGVTSTLIILLIFIFNFIDATAQQTYCVQNFDLSSYSFYITISDKDDINSQSYFQLYDEASEKVIFYDGESSLKPVNLKDAIKISSMHEIPFVNAHFINDVNFDGVKDLAIIYSTEPEGCYRDLYARIYLSNQNTFNYNSDISELYNNYYCMRSADIWTIPEVKQVCIRIGGAGVDVISFYQWDELKLKLVKESTEETFNQD